MAKSVHAAGLYGIIIRMRRPCAALALWMGFCLVMGAAGQATTGQRPTLGHCAGRKDKAAECFKIRGRLRAYEGSPRCRIWPVGTTRLLGVAGPLPPNVACGDGFEVYADFMVCPLTETKPTGLQMVCVSSATNIRVSEIKPGEGGH